MIVLLPTLFRGDRTPIEVYIQIGVVALLMVLGFISWLVTRWRIVDDDVLIETGLIRRRSLRFPLSQLQSVDVVRPGLARLFRVAELRLRMGGSTGNTGRLAYLPEAEVEPLRERLLALARGATPAPSAATVAPTPEEQHAPGRSHRAPRRVDPGQRRRALRRGGDRRADRDGGSLDERRRGRHPGRARLDHRCRDAGVAALQPGVPPDGRREPRWPSRALRAHRADRGDDQARPRSGRADGGADALAAVRLVPPRGRRRGPSAVEGRGAGAARAAANGAAGRIARARRRAARAPRSRSARCRFAAAAAGPLEEPAALPDAPRGPELRRASSRRAGGCAASPAGCRSRRRRASARCRARCSGACSWRRSTSTPSAVAFGPCSATGISRRSTRSCRASRACPRSPSGLRFRTRPARRRRAARSPRPRRPRARPD